MLIFKRALAHAYNTSEDKNKKKRQSWRRKTNKKRKPKTDEDKPLINSNRDGDCINIEMKDLTGSKEVCQ